jgi:hypothetical protein
MRRSSYIWLAPLTLLLASHSVSAQTKTYIEQASAAYRGMLGKPLLDSVVTLNNEQPIILETISTLGASFFYNPNKKVMNETFDALRQRTQLAITITTCSGSKDWTAKISSVAVWETLDADSRAHAGTAVQRIIEEMGPGNVVSTPSNLRAPRVASLNGVVFEYVKGDTTESLSFLTEGGELRLNWSAANTSFCPK